MVQQLRRIRPEFPSWFIAIHSVSIGIFLLSAGAAWSQVSTVTGAAATNAAVAPRVNLAVVAAASCSMVSGDTTLSALNDEFLPGSSRDNRRGSYGNWPATGTQWVEYDWRQPISTGAIDVYWWIDGAGVGAPAAYRLLYWDGNEFVPVKNPTGLEMEPNKFNATMFDEVRTTRLRLEMDSDGKLSTGILEWKVYDAGGSADQPPVVTAGPDRSVIRGGKTYLSGQVRYLKNSGIPSHVVWSKESGPGDVTFADARLTNTPATFSARGEYVLKLTAGEGAVSAASTLKVTVGEPPPPERLDVVYTKKYRIDSPLWNARAKALIVNWIPHCIDEINRTNIARGQGDGGIDNFIQAAKALRGERALAQKGAVFANAWVHQTVESMSIALMIDPGGDKEIIEAQKKMKATLEDWIPKILAAQEPDGYLQTAWTLRNTNRWRERWSAPGRGNHEGYTAGYFIESAINHYTLTGGKDKRLYNAAKKLADCWVANLGPGKKEWYDGHQEMEQALVRFGRFVNDMEGGGHGDNYIKLAKFLLDCRRNGTAYDQSHLPVIRQYEALGHAVRAVYNYSGMADVAAETHDPDYQSAVLSLWDSMVNRKYYVTGGIGSGDTSEGFGPDYWLRNNAYCEACSTCGLIFFQYKMNLAYHDARYADLYEESFYNALLGSMDLAGEHFYYDNALNGGLDRYRWHTCPCCVGNIPRTLLMIPTWTYARGKDALYVNLFIGSAINVENVAGTDVEMVQKTDYPWSGDVSITVNPRRAKNFSIYVRVPDRTTSRLYTPSPEVSGLKSLSINGSPVTPRIEKGYAVITRQWKHGDKIDFTLPMQVQRLKADEKVMADRGRVALRYGPLIYNVESVDGQDIQQPLGQGAFSTEWRGDLLGGVTVIKGSWADGSPMLAIPNYVRNNRNGTNGTVVDNLMGGVRQIGAPHSAGSMVWIKDK